MHSTQTPPLVITILCSMAVWGAHAAGAAEPRDTGTLTILPPGTGCETVSTGMFQGEVCRSISQTTMNGHWSFHDADGGELTGVSIGTRAGSQVRAQKEGQVKSSVFQGRAVSVYLRDGIAINFQEDLEGRHSLEDGGVLVGTTQLSTTQRGGTEQVQLYKEGRLSRTSFDGTYELTERVNNGDVARTEQYEGRHRLEDGGVLMGSTNITTSQSGGNETVQLYRSGTLNGVSFDGTYELTERVNNGDVARTEQYEGRHRLEDGGVLVGTTQLSTTQRGGTEQVHLQKDGQVVSPSFQGQLRMDESTAGAARTMTTEQNGEWPIGDGKVLVGRLYISESNGNVQVQDDRITR